MKKFITFILCTIFSFSVSYAYDAEVDGIYYNLIKKGKVAEVTSGSYKYSGNIQIPSTIKVDNIEYSVSFITENAFYECSNLKSVKLPSSIKKIGRAAFIRCKQLSKINLENSIEEIGEFAFCECISLKEINIPTSMTKVQMCTFENCKKITSIELHDNIKTISKEGFYGCELVKTLNIPANVEYIGSSAFSMLSCLEKIEVDKRNKYFDSRNNCNAVIRTKDNSLVIGCKNTVIETSITEIDTAAFAGRRGIVSLIIPENIKRIKYEAFMYCEDLENIQLPNTISKLEDYVFGYCTKLDNVVFPSKIKKIPCFILASCTNLKNVTIPTSVKEIDQKAFYKCTSLQNITIPENVTLIHAEAFYGDEALENVYCYAPNPPAIYKNYDPFENAYVNYSTLYVPRSSIEAYKATFPWSNFGTIMTIEQYDEANKVASDAVIAKINAIGKVEYTDACKSKIDDASNAYNALTADQKNLVSNLLTTAKQIYNNLKVAADKIIFDKYKSEIKVIIESLVKENDSDTVKNIIRKAISDIDALEYDLTISIDDNKAKIDSFLISVNETVESQRAEDQKTNGIEEQEYVERHNIYDLNGRKVSGSMLKSGLYIKNEKKVIVK